MGGRLRYTYTQRSEKLLSHVYLLPQSPVPTWHQSASDVDRGSVCARNICVRWRRKSQNVPGVPQTQHRRVWGCWWQGHCTQQGAQFLHWMQADLLRSLRGLVLSLFEQVHCTGMRAQRALLFWHARGFRTLSGQLPPCYTCFFMWDAFKRANTKQNTTVLMDAVCRLSGYIPSMSI